LLPTKLGAIGEANFSPRVPSNYDRFTRESGHRACHGAGQLWARSGHSFATRGRSSTSTSGPGCDLWEEPIRRPV